MKKVRLSLALAALAAFGPAYLVSPAFRAEVGQAAGILWRQDVAGLRDYILSFGAWAPVVSVLLMVLQAVAAPLPAFPITFANGLAFGAVRGGLLSLFGATLAAVISFYLARVFLVGKAGLETADEWFERWGGVRRPCRPARSHHILRCDLLRRRPHQDALFGFLSATVLGAALATFVYSFLGEREPQYANVLLVGFGAVTPAGVVAALIRRRRAKRAAP